MVCSFVSVLVLVVRGKPTYPEIPWINQKRIFHMLADTHEFAQDKRRIICPTLGDNKFHTGGVHPVPERRNHREVSYAQQGVEFVFLQCLVATIDKMSRIRIICQGGKRTNGERGRNPNSRTRR